jgi:hypothetical protein
MALCGSLDPLPCRATFRCCNAFHLVEPRCSIANVRSILQRLLPLFGECKLGCRDSITTWLAQLCHIFLLESIRTTFPGLFSFF